MERTEAVTGYRTPSVHMVNIYIERQVYTWRISIERQVYTT